MTARARFSRAVYRAEFAEGGRISDQELLRAVLASEGLDPETCFAKGADPTIKQALRQETDLAKSHRIFGAPSWRTADGELFWGNDRLEEALDWALTHADSQAD